MWGFFPLPLSLCRARSPLALSLSLSLSLSFARVLSISLSPHPLLSLARSLFSLSLPPSDVHTTSCHSGRSPSPSLSFLLFLSLSFSLTHSWSWLLLCEQYCPSLWPIRCKYHCLLLHMLHDTSCWSDDTNITCIHKNDEETNVYVCMHVHTHSTIMRKPNIFIYIQMCT